MSAKIIFLYAALAGLASAAQNASSITTNCVTSYGTKAQCHLTTSHTSETKTIPIEVKVTVGEFFVNPWGPRPFELR